MKKRHDFRIVFCIGAAILLIATIFIPLGRSDFIVPPGGMVHQDPTMLERIKNHRYLAKSLNNTP